MQAVHRGIMSSVMERKEKIMSIEKRLHEASLSGNVDLLNQLMAEDRLALARVSTTCFNENPLHIAAMLGHSSFVQALVRYRPKLAVELDCRGSSPLHLASANGYTETVKYLLQVSSDMCLVRDEEDRTPLHLAIMKGWVDVAKELIQVKPEAADSGESLLHLAVKYNRFTSLKLLMELAGVSRDSLNTRDNNGNTILHLAAYLKQTETVKYLLGAGITTDAVNANGFTALDIVENMPRDLKAMEILMMLSKTAGSSSTGRIPRSSGGIAESNIIDNGRNVNLPKKEEDWVDKKFASLTIAVTVVASMAYQAVLSPPGGLWSSDSGKDDKQKFKAGTSILATMRTVDSQIFWICNTISFISSFSILFLLVSGFPLRRKFMVWVLMFAMSITITSIAVAYSVAMWTLQPDTEELSTQVADMVVYAWLILLVIVFLVQTVRFFIVVCKKLRKSCLSRRTSTRTRTGREYSRVIISGLQVNV